MAEGEQEDKTKTNVKYLESKLAVKNITYVQIALSQGFNLSNRDSSFAARVKEILKI